MHTQVMVTAAADLSLPQHGRGPVLLFKYKASGPCNADPKRHPLSLRDPRLHINPGLFQVLLRIS